MTVSMNSSVVSKETAAQAPATVNARETGTGLLLHTEVERGMGVGVRVRRKYQKRPRIR